MKNLHSTMDSGTPRVLRRNAVAQAVQRSMGFHDARCGPAHPSAFHERVAALQHDRGPHPIRHRAFLPRRPGNPAGYRSDRLRYPAPSARVDDMEGNTVDRELPASARAPQAHAGAMKTPISTADLRPQGSDLRPLADSSKRSEV